jgi:hypothetical protein
MTDYLVTYALCAAALATGHSVCSGNSLCHREMRANLGYLAVGRYMQIGT